MSGTGSGGKFSTTSLGHSHADTPKVIYGATPPVVAVRGDTFIQTS